MPAAAATERVPRKLQRRRDNHPSLSLRQRAPSDPSSAGASNPAVEYTREQLANHPALIDSPIASSHYPPRKHLRSQTFDITTPDQYQQPRYSLYEKPSTELLGQRWDSAAILNNFDSILQQPDPSAPPLPHQHSDLTTARPTHPATAIPATTARANTNIVANPDVRLSESLAATGRKMEELPNARGPPGARNPTSRLSDEAKENKMLKKKSGFSKFMNELVGSPRRPAISAPENPVHVTHVGYDQETGEFTVCSPCELRAFAML